MDKKLPCVYKHVQYVIEKQELAFLRQIREFRVPIFPYASLAGKKVSSYFAVTYCVQTWSVVTFVRAETWLNVERVHAHTCMRQKGITIVCVCVCVYICSVSVRMHDGVRHLFCR